MPPSEYPTPPELSPELRETLTEIIDKAYRGGRREDGMTAAQYAVNLLEPVFLSVDTHAHQRGRRQMANEVEPMLRSARFMPGLPDCDWETCACAFGRLWRTIKLSTGVIEEWTP